MLDALLKKKKKKEPMAKTALMHATNLDWRNFKERFEFLQEKELIAETNEENAKRYNITDKGLGYIIEFKRLQKILA